MCTIPGHNIDKFLTTGIMNDPELKKYAEEINNHAQNSIDYYFGNKGEIRAAIVLEKLIKYSNEVVRIYTGGLNGPVSESKIFKDAIQEFIEKPNTKLYLLHPQGVNMNSSGYDLIKRYLTESPTKVKEAVASDAFSEKILRILDTGEFFTLGDSNKFRIETDPAKLEAIVNYNSSHVVNILSRVFDEEFISYEKNK